MQVPFSNEEFNKFTDILCEKYDSCCDDCPVNKDCMSYYLFEQGFALNDKETIQKGLRFAQKMNDIKFTVYEIAKIPIKNFNTLEEAEKFIDTDKPNDNYTTYTIELTES